MSPPPRGSVRAADDPHAPRYTVRAVAARLGVPTATLRSWTQRYGIGPPGHSPGQHRLYTDTDIAVLRHMHTLIGRGVNPASAARTALAAVVPERADTGALLGAALKLDAATAAQLLDRHLRHYGVVETWDQLVRPVFADIVEQQSDGGCVDVEHVLSWTVARALQRVVQAPAADASIVLCCTESEWHSLPLEALRAALAERHRGALMLGAAVPAAALLDALGRQAGPWTVVLWSHAADTADTGTVAAAVQAGAQVLLGGPGWDDVELPPGAQRVASLQDALDRATG